MAFRYLRPKRTFLSLITLISVLGVILGTTVLIVVISVMTGFERELERKIVGFEPTADIIGGGTSIKNWREVLKQAESVSGVTGVAPFMQGRVIAQSNLGTGQNVRLTPWVLGVDPATEGKVIDLHKFMKSGSADLDGDSCILGSALADQLGVTTGDNITVFSPGNLNQIVELLQEAQNDQTKKNNIDKAIHLLLPHDLTVIGIFETGRYIFDSDYVVVPLYIGQELYDLEDTVHGLGIRNQDPFQIDAVKAGLQKILRPPLQVSTWIEQNQDRFTALQVERTTMFFILFFVVLVAAFGIMSTLITTTVQKTREIGLMKALGARVSQILWIFLAQGMVVGFFGTLLGLVFGFLTLQFRDFLLSAIAYVFHVQVFPRTVYEFSSLPAEIVPRDVAVICLGGFLICSLAALIPAYFAARLDPVKALRHE